MCKTIIVALAIFVGLSVPASLFAQDPGGIAVSGSVPEPKEKAFDRVVGLMEDYGSRPDATFMKVGRVAIAMGKAFGKAATDDSWIRMVIKAFKKVSGVYILDYGEGAMGLRDAIEESVLGNLVPTDLVLRNMMGSVVSDETYGSMSPNGKEVSNLVIILYGQSVVCIRGTLAASDVGRTVNRLKQQL